MGKSIDLTGRKFGRLSVLCMDTTKRKHWQSYWKCKCDCGTVKTILGRSLQKGDTTSCGCFFREIRAKSRKRPYEAHYNRFYRRAVKHYTNVVPITYEEFLEFVKIKNCHYCGDPVLWHEYTRSCDANGCNLDRKDNDKGYTKENCVVCCGQCNKGKSNIFNYEGWLAITKFMHEHTDIFKGK
jgi:hypothetical protein